MFFFFLIIYVIILFLFYNSLISCIFFLLFSDFYFFFFFHTFFFSLFQINFSCNLFLLLLKNRLILLFYCFASSFYICACVGFFSLLNISMILVYIQRLLFVQVLFLFIRLLFLYITKKINWYHKIFLIAFSHDKN